MASNEALIGESPRMAATRQGIREYARADATTLVCGETGTGKERVARALKGSSPRAARAFVSVDSSALPSELGESELFGNTLGAWGELNSDVRIVAAIPRDIPAPCAKGELRPGPSLAS